VLVLIIHPDAKQDLLRLKESDPYAAARIAVVLQELQGNQDLMDRLTQDKFGIEGRHDFNVRGLASQFKAGHNLWRLKVWNLERRAHRYRVIYAFVPSKGYHYVLGIMPREIDYERDDDFIRRVERAYDDVREGRW